MAERRNLSAQLMDTKGHTQRAQGREWWRALWTVWIVEGKVRRLEKDKVALTWRECMYKIIGKGEA